MSHNQQTSAGYSRLTRGRDRVLGMRHARPFSVLVRRGPDRAHLRPGPIAFAPGAGARVEFHRHDRRAAGADLHHDAGERRQDRHGGRLQGQDRALVFRLHLLPGRLPDHADERHRHAQARWASRPTTCACCSSRSIPTATRWPCSSNIPACFAPQVVGLRGTPDQLADAGQALSRRLFGDAGARRPPLRGDAQFGGLCVQPRQATSS